MDMPSSRHVLSNTRENRVNTGDFNDVAYFNCLKMEFRALPPTPR
jgi:hypothetical protein